jgi:hypothetical protein
MIKKPLLSKRLLDELAAHKTGSPRDAGPMPSLPPMAPNPDPEPETLESVSEPCLDVRSSSSPQIKRKKGQLESQKTRGRSVLRQAKTRKSLETSENLKGRIEFLTKFLSSYFSTPAQSSQTPPA